MPESINCSDMLQVGTRLNGQYRIERYLSSGGFGNTYAAINEFDERVAIKEFFLKGINHREGDSTTVSVSNPTNEELVEQQLKKFKKEAKRLRSLHNPHIVKVLSLFEENGTAYYVMDYIEGTSLSARLENKGPLPEEEVTDILVQTLDALEVIHDNGLYHLDIKPGNIMLDEQGLVYIIDFGASKQISGAGGVTTTSQTAHTAGYAPPEQVDGKMDKIGAWTDFYALGATLYRLLTNQTPPQFSDIIDVGDKAFLFPEQVSPQMKDLIRWMMSPARNERPQSAVEVKARLAEISEVQAKVYGPPTPGSEEENQVELVTKVHLDSETETDEHVQNEEDPIFRKKHFLIIIGVAVLLLIVYFVINNSGGSGYDPQVGGEPIYYDNGFDSQEGRGPGLGDYDYGDYDNPY